VAVGSALVVAAAQNPPVATGGVQVCIRAEDVILLKGADVRSSARNHWPAVVKSVGGEGRLMRVELDCGFPLTALLTRQACEELAIQPGDRVVALVKAPHVRLMAK
jgi:molybdate transport system ATP-binding protein